MQDVWRPRACILKTIKTFKIIVAKVDILCNHSQACKKSTTLQENGLYLTVTSQHAGVESMIVFWCQSHRSLGLMAVYNRHNTRRDSDHCLRRAKMNTPGVLKKLKPSSPKLVNKLRSEKVADEVNRTYALETASIHYWQIPKTNLAVMWKHSVKVVSADWTSGTLVCLYNSKAHDPTWQHSELSAFCHQSRI